MGVEGKELLKKIVAIIIIIMMTMADFAIVGTHAVSYAIDIFHTNNENISFFAYFINSENEKVTEIESDINAKEVDMYVEIALKDDGYFNGQIALGNASFNIKEEILEENGYVNKIENNIVTLNRIEAGTTATIKLKISYSNAEEINTLSLKQQNEIKLIGSYVSSKNSGEDINIEGNTSVIINWRSLEKLNAQLEAKVLTNKIYKVNEENKRIVQLLVKSNLKEDVYPIKNTKIELTAPVGIEGIKVHAKSTKATNGKEKFEEQTYEYNEQIGTLSINIKNEEIDGKIKWNKNAEDIIIVSYVYPDTADLSSSKINVKNIITIYDNEKEANKETEVTLEGDINGVITSEINLNEKEIYKGNLYIGQDKFYTMDTSININYANTESVYLENKPATFCVESDLEANIQYVQSKIKKENFYELFGEKGHITILDQDKNIIANINNQTSEVDENGYINITYSSGVEAIIITSSVPVKEGELKIHHRKVVKKSNYTRTEINTFTGIKEETENKDQIKNSKVIQLKETTMQTEFEINKESLTTVSKNEGVILQVKLLTNGEDKELYKNPVLKIRLPKEINKVENAQVRIQNGNGLELEKSEIKEEDGRKVVTIELKGEHKQYSSEAIEGTLIQLRLDCNLSDISTSGEVDFVLKGTNENTSQQINNKTSIKIINPNSIITSNNVTGKEGQDNIKFEVNTQEKKSNVGIQIINNENGSISNVMVMGELPTDNTNNNLGITLENKLNIETGNNNVKIYYTDIQTATDDINNDNNKWKEDIPKNVKKYLIKIDKLEKGESLKANYEIKIPSNLTYNLSAQTQYQVKYIDDTTSKNKIVDSNKLILSTEAEAQVQYEVKASVGEAILQNGDDVKAGEVIKYEITLENKGDKEASSVKVEAIIPAGTKRVIYEKMYEELLEREIVFEKISLKKGEKKTLEYEVRVNKDITDNTEVNNQIKVTYDNQQHNNKITHKLRSGDISIEIQIPPRDRTVLKAGYSYDYVLAISNNSTVDKTNVKLNINVNELLQVSSIFCGEAEINMNSDGNSATINKIEANKTVYMTLTVVPKLIKEDVKEATISANLIDADNTSYRSNKLIEKVEGIQLEVTLTSSTNSKLDNNYVQSGDTIQYSIKIKNIGEIDAKSLVVKDKIINYLTIKSVKLDGNEVKYEKETIFENEKSYTSIIIDKELLVGKECKIDIITTVNEITTEEILQITNNLQVYGGGVSINKVADVYYFKNTEEVFPSEIPDKPVDKEEKYTITGTVWYDKNKNGEKAEDEEKLKDINVMLLNANTNKIIYRVQTNDQGFYSFTDISKGKYVVIFEYDKGIYIPTIYQAEGVSTSKNSDALQNRIKLDNEYKVVAVTDSIELSKDLSNIDLGLVKAEKFDLELHKYVSKISVVNSKGTKVYNFDKSTLAKVEIPAKDLKASKVVIEYEIEIKNTGELSGYVQNVVDYKSEGLEFSSTLNKDWYQSGKYLYNDSLSNIEIKPGETKTIKLILNKTMTDSNTGVTNNTAEIQKSYNTIGIADIDSASGNNQPGEDDLGSADVIISVRTGKVATGISLMISMLIVVICGVYVIKKKY